MDLTEKIEKWAEKLTPEQAKEILAEVVFFMVDTEDLEFSEEDQAPYWPGSGERLGETED